VFCLRFHVAEFHVVFGGLLFVSAESAFEVSSTILCFLRRNLFFLLCRCLLLPFLSCCPLFPAALSFLLALRGTWVYEFALPSATLQPSFHHHHFGAPKPTYFVITYYTNCLITEPSSALGFTHDLSTGINSHSQVIPPLFTFPFFLLLESLINWITQIVSRQTSLGTQQDARHEY
jgi:hypothetical protein